MTADKAFESLLSKLPERDQQGLLQQGITDFPKLLLKKTQLDGRELENISNDVQMVLKVVCVHLESLDSVDDFSWEGLENFCEFSDNSGDYALDLAEETKTKKPESEGEKDPDGLNLTLEERKQMEEQVENDPLTMKIRGFSARALQWETDEKNKKIVEEASEKREVAFNGKVYYVNKCYHHQQPNGTNVIVGISKFTSNEKKAICRLIVKFNETLMGPDLEEVPPIGVPATYEEDQTSLPEYVKVWEEPGFEPIVPLSSLKPCAEPSMMPELMFEPQRPGQPPHNFGYIYERDGSNRGKERKEIRTVELFAGSGGFHQGVMQEPNFKGIAAVEYWDKAVNTFKHNCKDPDTKVYLQKVEDFLDEYGPTPTEFRKAHGKIDALFASPPCQSFSGSNRDVDHNGEKDLYRKGLSLKFFDATQTSGALIGVFENVEGMWRRPNIYFLKKIVIDHLRAGWQVRVGLHRAHRYGDPQARPRLLIMAARKFVEMPKMTETHGHGKHPFMTVGNAFKALDQTLEDIEKNPDTMKVIPNLEGANLKKVDKEEEILKAHKPAGTIRAGGRAWHPTKDRAITVREAATLQSYPYDYEFMGTLTDQYKQVGNAVPGKMAKAIAHAVKESLRFIYDEEYEKVSNKEEEDDDDFDENFGDDGDEEMVTAEGNNEKSSAENGNSVATKEKEAAVAEEDSDDSTMKEGEEATKETSVSIVTETNMESNESAVENVEGSSDTVMKDCAAVNTESVETVATEKGEETFQKVAEEDVAMKKIEEESMVASETVVMAGCEESNPKAVEDEVMTEADNSSAIEERKLGDETTKGPKESNTIEAKETKSQPEKGDEDAAMKGSEIEEGEIKETVDSTKAKASETHPEKDDSTTPIDSNTTMEERGDSESESKELPEDKESGEEAVVNEGSAGTSDDSPSTDA